MSAPVYSGLWCKSNHIVGLLYKSWCAIVAHACVEKQTETHAGTDWSHFQVKADSLDNTPRNATDCVRMCSWESALCKYTRGTQENKRKWMDQKQKSQKSLETCQTCSPAFRRFRYGPHPFQCAKDMCSEYRVTVYTLLIQALQPSPISLQQTTMSLKKPASGDWLIGLREM